MTVRLHHGPLTRAVVLENPDPLLDRLLTDAGVDVVRRPHADEDGLIALLREHGAHALFKRSKVQVTRRVVASCPDLRAIQLCCIGDDSVDKQACADHGVLVFNDPVSNGRSVVELAIAHLIALSRRLYETDAATRRHTWDKSNDERWEVQGKVLGIVGLGNIGRGVARAAEALGMQVRFYETREAAAEVGEELGYVRSPGLVDLFRGSDAVSVHVSAEDVQGVSNEGLLSHALGHLGADRPADSPRVFLNLSRGFLHTADELRAAVRSGAVRRAAVDVFPDEPGAGQVWTNPYADEPRIATTPHIGAATLEAQPRIARRVAQTFLSYSRSGSLRDCVFAPRSRLSLTEDGGVVPVLLAVAHSTARGTKRAIDEAIFEAGASNLSSVHRDFDRYGLAWDLSALDTPLSDDALRGLADRATGLTGDPNAIRAVRQIVRGQ